MPHCSLPVRRAALAAALAAAVAVPAVARPPATPRPLPNSMAALGDSITRAFTDCGILIDCPAESWATGTDPAVDSQYLRLLALNPAISGNNDNFAVSGAKATDLAAEATAAVAAQVDYVTVLIGANDACASTTDGMTSVADFRSQVQSALDVISLGDAKAKVFVASIPDIYRLWQVGSPHAKVRARWTALGICQSMLANPASMAPADVARRQFVLQRVEDYNTQLQQECASHANCVWDGEAVFNRDFSLADLGAVDYFHPSIRGQALLAKKTFAIAKAGFGW